MSDKVRTSADVQTEYNNLAFKAGNLQYELFEREANLKSINETLRSLAQEFMKLKTTEKAAADAAAAAPQAPAADASLASDQTQTG
jgi:hypothetical protein